MHVIKLRLVSFVVFKELLALLLVPILILACPACSVLAELLVSLLLLVLTLIILLILIVVSRRAVVGLLGRILIVRLLIV